MWILIPLLELSLTSFHKFVGADLDLFGIVYIEAGMGSVTSHEISIKISNVDRRRVSSLKNKLPSKSPLSRQTCIFRVPITVLGGCKPYVYEPRLVSIGPFHHGKQPNLKEMEGVKLWYLQCLLNRLPTTSLDHFFKAIREMETYCRQCYAEEINLSSDQFIEMMVLDGCFIIELFRRFEIKKRPGRSISDNDPVFDVTWKLSPLAHDLLLLENQLPWEVLKCLWDLTTSPEERRRDEYSLHSHAFHFFREVLVVPIEYTSHETRRRHLLDVLRNILLGSFVHYGLLLGETNADPIPCATDLWQARVKFEMLKSSDFPSIGFSEGEMSIPQIVVHENSEILFKNIIAFEQCDPDCSISIISSYAAVLCDLFHSTKDVDLLSRKGIVFSFLNPEDTLGFFKSLSNGVVINCNFYGAVYGRVNSFLKEPWSKMQRRWNKYTAMLKRDYFNSPWSIINVIAATLILGFTLTQTLFAIFAYSKSSNPKG